MLPSARYSGILNRFYVQENRPIYYGTRHDSAILALILVSVFAIVHIVALFITRAFKHNHMPLWKLIEGPYLQNNALLIALLLEGWLLGYCAVSWTIWWQFERNERLEPDDYMPIISDGGNNNGMSVSRSVEMTVGKDDGVVVAPATIVQLPDGDFVLGSGAGSSAPNPIKSQ